MDNPVAHDGLVVSLTDKLVRVKFIAHSACSACHAKGICSVSGSAEKYADVPNEGYDLSIGESVEVLLEQKQGFRALYYAYLLPLVILLAVLFAVYFITGKEELAGLAGLGSMIPYYLIIYLLRKRISRSVHFSLRKQNN